MKYIKEVAVIFGISMIGEVLNRLLPLPIPAGVYGLFLLLAALLLKIVRVENVESTGEWLLDTMPLMFVPVSVGLMTSFDELKAIVVPFVAISMLSTFAVMIVTGLIADFIIKRKNGKEVKE